jgi:hypothetical protein
MSVQTNFESDLTKAIHSALTEVAEKEIKRAVAETEVRIRKEMDVRIGEIAVAVAKRFNYNALSDEVLISIRRR